MTLVPIAYEGDDQATFRSFSELPEEEINGHIWESNDIGITNIKKSIKDHYILAQDYTCPYCQQRMEIDHNATWDAEHIIPKSSHPKFTFTPLNLCVSCKDCNNEKRDKKVLVNNNRSTFPSRSTDYKIVHPHFDNFHDHIRVIELAGYYLPLTEKGRRTIEKCGLLRFAYKFANYGSTSQENKETILELANVLIDANTPAEENACLGILADAAQLGQKISKQAFIEQLRGNR